MYYNDKLGKKKDVQFYFRERLRMKEKMNTKEGISIYGLRKITVEHVIGNLKQNLDFREFGDCLQLKDDNFNFFV